MSGTINPITDKGVQSPTVIEFAGLDLTTAGSADLWAQPFSFPYDGRIVRVELVVTTASIGADDDSATINLEIGGTNAVGGVVSVQDALGVIQATLVGTDISQVFKSSDDIDIEIVQATDAITTGVGTLRVYVEFENIGKTI